MPVLNLTDIVSGHGQISTINANNALIEAAINDLVALRDVPTGETAPMLDDLDMNARRLLNLPTPTNLSEPATKAYVDAIAGLSTTTGVVTTTETQTATVGQTVFTLVATTYTPGSNNLDVYINGVHQDLSVYTETSTSVVTLNNPVTAGDSLFFKVNQRSVSSDIVTSSNVTHTPAGAGAVATTAETQLNRIVWLSDFGAVGDGVTDDTAAINAAYTHADSLEAELWIPPGDYLFTSALTWDGDVHVIGVGANQSLATATGVTFIASGAFDAITIVNGGDAIFENFILERSSGDGAGIIVENGNRMNMKHVAIAGMTGAGGHGLWIKGAFRGHWDTVLCVENEGDNIRLEGGGIPSAPAVNANLFSNCVSRSPGLSHLHFVEDADANVFINLGVEDDGNASAVAAILVDDATGTCLNNWMLVYAEDTADPIVEFTASSQNNFIQFTTIGAVTDDKIKDEGSNNTVWPMGASASLRIPIVEGGFQGTGGGTGRTLSVLGGAGNDQSGNSQGGVLDLVGGGAGNGDANGGALRINGGAASGSGTTGQIQIGGVGSGTVLLLSPFVYADAVDVVTDTAACSLDTQTSMLVTTGAAVPTLADGTNLGQVKQIVMRTDGGDAVLTPADENLNSNFQNGTTITFTDVGDTATLQWLNTGGASAWHFMGGTAQIDLEEGSATWDPGSIADGDEEAKEITVTGAALGDFILVSFSLDVADLTLTAQVTTANTVTAVLANNTGGAIDLAEGTVKAKVIR